MKFKTLALLLIILAVLAGTGLLITRLNRPQGEEREMGKPLFKNLPVNDIASVVVQAAGESVALARKGDQWVVRDRFDYPADFNKMADLVRKFKDLKIGRSFEATDATRKRLSLKAPDDPEASQAEKAKSLRFESDQGDPIARILLGQTRKTGQDRAYPNGQYLMVGEEPRVYLVDQHFALLQTSPRDWLMKELLKVPAAEVQKIICTGKDGKMPIFTLQRKTPGQDLALSDPPKDRRVDGSAVNKLAGALSSLSLEDVEQAVPAEDDAKTSSRLAYHLFNGTVYHVRTARDPETEERYLMNLAVEFQAVEKETGTGGSEGSKEESKKEEKKPEKSPEEIALEAGNQNERFRPWRFVIPEWKHDAFIMDMDKLLESPDKDKKKS